VLAWLSVWSEVHMAHLMPLPLTVFFCFSKIQIGFTFLVPAHPGSPGKRAIKRVCVCVVKQMLSWIIFIVGVVVRVGIWLFTTSDEYSAQ